MFEIDVLLSFIVFLIVITILINFSYVYIQEKIENYKIQKYIQNKVIDQL